MKKYQTSKRNTAKKTLIRDSLNGKFFTLYLPFSTGKTFSIGQVTFENKNLDIIYKNITNQKLMD